MNLCGMQADFATAAEGHALGRGHYRLGRVFDREIHVLKLLYGHVQFVPLLLLRSDENEHQICADGKIHRLVSDNHCIKIGLQTLQALVQHGNQIGADGIHLGVKFAADHAIAKVDEACAGIPLDFAAGILQRFENHDPFGLFDFFRRAAGDIENGRGSLLRFVKPLATAG